MGVPLNHAFSWDVPFETIQLLGYSPLMKTTPYSRYPQIRLPLPLNRGTTAPPQVDRALADLDALSPELAMVVAEFQEEPWSLVALVKIDRSKRKKLHETMVDLQKYTVSGCFRHIFPFIQVD